MESTTNLQSSKRRLIKAVALGTTAAVVAPKEWSRPMIERLITPAHAQTGSAAAGVYSFEAPIG